MRQANTLRGFHTSTTLRILNFKIVNNRADLRKYLLATSDFGKNIQEGINSVVNDGHFNNVAIRHLLDDKNKGVF